MDNLAHSLAGASLGYAGLKQKTGLGLLTLIVAANIPDVDGVAMLIDKHLVWRRGWTHGPVGVLLFPPLIAAAMLGFDCRCRSGLCCCLLTLARSRIRCSISSTTTGCVC